MNAPTTTNDGQAGRSFEARFATVVARTTGLATLPAGDIRFADLGLDSLAFLGLLMELEDEFGTLWPVEYLTGALGGASVAELSKATREVLWQGRADAG
jgi:acyl carrier protein